MFCAKCGKEDASNLGSCVYCGHRLRVDALVTNDSDPKPAQPSAVKGFFVLWIRGFTMPLHTFNLTTKQLRQIGAEGTLALTDETPHLNYLRVAGGTVSCFCVSLIALASSLTALGYLLDGISRLRYGFGDFFEKAVQAVGILLAGGLSVIAVDWLFMLGIELIGVVVGIAYNVKKFADKSDLLAIQRPSPQLASLDLPAMNKAVTQAQR